MNPADEVVSAPTDEPIPLPCQVAGEGCAPAPLPPTPEALLRVIAAAGPEPWFPSAYARKTGAPRDTLDDPLTELRLAGLVRVAVWVRGAGQGYLVTEEGEAALLDPAALALLQQPSPPLPASIIDTSETLIGPAHDPAPRSPRGIDLRPPVVTPLLMAANLIWFVVGLAAAPRFGVSVGDYLSHGGDPNLLIRLGAVSPTELLGGEWWRLLTNCFVHIGVLHLIVNLIALGMMAPLAELLWGRWRLMAVYAVSGLGGSCLAMAVGPETDGRMAVLAGASGAICGVGASLIAWLYLFRRYLPTDVAADLSRRLSIVFISVAASSLLPHVSWQAHLGGGVAGFLTAWLLNAVRFTEGTRRLLAVVSLLAIPGACVGGLVAAMKAGDSWAEIRARQARLDEENRARVNRAEMVAWANVFNKEVAPLAVNLSPAKVHPIERGAVFAALLGPKRQPPRAAARSSVEQLRAEAAAVMVRLAEFPPTGVPAFDTLVSRMRAIAEARVRSFDLLLAMLAKGAVPDVASWQAWGAATRDADRLWAELGLK